MMAFAALSDTLRDLVEAIGPLGASAFVERRVAASGSIGGHVRHCLDHVWALERGMATGAICYDHRQRNSDVEQDPQLARTQLRRAAACFGAMDDRLLDRPLTLVARLHADGRSVRTASTVAREVAFVISHTVHHNAVIAVLLETSGRQVPARFGLAPTTPVPGDLVDRGRAACAR